MDIKNTFSSDKDESTLESVVFGEKVAIDAYQDALDSRDLCPERTSVVLDQLHTSNHHMPNSKIQHKV
ncbi:hypothetical protein [Chryseobacterium sp. FH1]|uniref:hypothetical protein n=1 Tax=Chryseobacterium sp. FH1 TaxID=1233951 RepID=UPI0009DEE210|nr:hypothetical protein [Chryseobacterium sp. FH1]